jgi:endonuclease/exonuclease/phosphatase family metal-dependent hydrolase
MRAVIRRKTPIVIAGDFNTKYRHSMREVVQELTHAGYENAFGGRQQRTHVIIGALDYIFVRGPIRVSDVKVRKDLHGSDHFRFPRNS